jgi:hypothetical protein
VEFASALLAWETGKCLGNLIQTNFSSACTAAGALHISAVQPRNNYQAFPCQATSESRNPKSQGKENTHDVNKAAQLAVRQHTSLNPIKPTSALLAQLQGFSIVQLSKPSNLASISVPCEIRNPKSEKPRLQILNANTQ